MRRVSIIAVALLSFVCGGCGGWRPRKVRMVKGNLVVPRHLVTTGTKCEYECSDGSTLNMYCGGTGTISDFCDLVKAAGCPRGTTFVSGKCNGTDCS